MAKTTGPLLSISASGTVANTLTYVASRGQNIVRALVTPANPQTIGQSMARIVLVASGAMTSRMNLNQVGSADADAQNPKEYFTALRVAPQTWNSEFGRRAFPDGRTTFESDQDAWAGLDQAQMDAWATWNTAFSNPFTDVTPPPGGAVAVVGAAVGFTWARALGRAGYIETVPLATPPIWDNTLRAYTRSELLADRRSKGTLARKLMQENEARKVKHTQAQIKQHTGN